MIPKWKSVDWDDVRAGDYVNCSHRSAIVQGIVSKAGLNSITVGNVIVMSSFEGIIRVDTNYRASSAMLPSVPGSVIVAYTVEGNEGCWNMMLDDYGMWCSPTPIGDFVAFEFPPESIQNFDLAEVVIVDAN